MIRSLTMNFCWWHLVTFRTNRLDQLPYSLCNFQVQTFRQVSDIPSKFLTSHITLQGQVKQINHKGLLLINHEPAFVIPFSSWLRKYRKKSNPGKKHASYIVWFLTAVRIQSLALPFLFSFFFVAFVPDMLPVQLANVQMTEPGREWLEGNVLHKHIWFQLLFKTEENVMCSVSIRKVRELVIGIFLFEHQVKL